MWGKLIFGGCGYLVGGLLGLFIGVLIGHQIDRRMVSFGIFSAGVGGVNHTEIQQAFFETTFSVMGCVAKADGRVSEEEISLARQIMMRMSLSEVSRQEAIRLFSAGKQEDFHLENTLARFRIATQRAHNLRQMFIEIQLHAAYADGELNPAEHKLLLHICNVLGFSPLDLERLDAMIRAERHAAQGGRAGQAAVSTDDAYAILNIQSSASDAEVKRAYRRLMNQHHPDKLVAKGLPKEMMKLAEEKTHEIRTAYERIREARGF